MIEFEIKEAAFSLGYSYSHFTKMICGERINTINISRV